MLVDRFSDCTPPPPLKGKNPSLYDFLGGRVAGWGGEFNKMRPITVTVVENKVWLLD